MIETKYKITTLTDQHKKQIINLFTRSFCDSEPITKHLRLHYGDYEPFATAVVTKAVADGMSVVALDEDDEVVACTIAEDIAYPFLLDTAKYPKLKPIFALLDQLSLPFLTGKKFLPGKIAHVWIAIVDPAYRGQGLSTQIDMACGELAVRKGFDFAYAEFTNPISEKITGHYATYQLCNTVAYNNFQLNGSAKPFNGVKGEATAYIVAIRPGIKIDSLKNCYIIGDA